MCPDLSFMNGLQKDRTYFADFLEKDYFILFLILYLFMCVCLWECGVYECKCPQRPEGILDPQRLELQELVSHLIWLLGSSFGSSSGVVSFLNC